MLTRPILLALVMVALALGAQAARGGPDAFGHEWRDRADGCPFELGEFVGPSTRFDSPAGVLGPMPLGFTMPFFGEPVNQVWIHPNGFIAFSDPGASGSTPVALPAPGLPDRLIAVGWHRNAATAVEVASAEGAFEVRWTWPAVFGAHAAGVLLDRSGDVRLTWGVSGGFDDGMTVGWEDATGARGVTLFRDGNGVEPGFPDSLFTQSACVTAPTLLDCSAPAILGCGDTLDGTLQARPGEDATVYTCTDVAHEGPEQVVRLDLDTPLAVELRLVGAGLGLHRVAGPPDCAERACLAHATDVLAEPLLLAGSHYFVVDALAAGDAPFSLTATCTSPAPLGCGATELVRTAGGPSGFDEWPCSSTPLPGPEAYRLLDTTAPGHVVVTAAGGPEDVHVLILSEAGECLAGGPGGAAAYDVPAGRYLLVVDGVDPAGVDVVLSARCGRQADCASAATISCSSILAGDTRGAGARLDVSACSGAVVDGGEQVHRLVLAEAGPVSARFLESAPGQRLLFLSSCDEATCLGDGPLGACAELPAGESFLIVDGPAGSEGPYRIQLSCGNALSIGNDLAVTDVRLGDLGGGCGTLDVAGTVTVSVSQRGTAPNVADVRLVVFEDRDGNARYAAASDALLGESVVAAGLGAGGSDSVAVPVSGALAYRGAAIAAQVDPERLHDDADRTNDGISAATPCSAPAAPISFDPVIEWSWTGSVTLPDMVNVLSMPLVGDLDGDGQPEIVALTESNGECSGPGGVVRAFSGATGAELWAAVDLGSRFRCASHAALVDLDGDALPEIVGVSGAFESGLRALDGDGTFLWDSPPPLAQLVTKSGTVFAADIDGDGSPELTYGIDVYRADGTRFWTPEGGGTIGVAFHGPASVVLDVDGDGVQEVIAGPTAYEWDAATGQGRIRWRAAGLADGHVAVGQLDADAAPEIILSTSGRVTALDAEDGEVLWSRDLPVAVDCGVTQQSGGAAPAAIGDLDGDGAVEIVTASSDRLITLRADGTPWWAAPIVECSSGFAPAALFDFDADGLPEIAHADEVAFRIFRGTDGAELATVPRSSGTAIEQVAIADVDADGRAEVVVGQNPWFPNTGVGLLVIGGAGDGWAGTRTLVNQHAHHVTNIRDDFSVPRSSGLPCQAPSALAAGGFRLQEATPPAGAALPNLTLLLHSVEARFNAACRLVVTALARVANAGGAPSAPSMVAVRDGDVVGGRLVSVEPLPALLPGEWIDVPVVVDPAIAGVSAVADDDGTGAGAVAECREDDNACSLTAESIIDLTRAWPEPVGASLRVRDHGDPLAAVVTAVLDWSLDPHAPRPADQHYHVVRGTDPQALIFRVSPEPFVATSLEDGTPAASSLPLVHFYRVLAADSCENEERSR